MSTDGNFKFGLKKGSIIVVNLIDHVSTVIWELDDSHNVFTLNDIIGYDINTNVITFKSDEIPNTTFSTQTSSIRNNGAL